MEENDDYVADEDIDKDYKKYSDFHYSMKFVFRTINSERLRVYLEGELTNRCSLRETG